MTFDVKRLFLWLTAANLALVGVYLAGGWLRLPWAVQRAFDLNAEATLAAWYNGALLLLGGVTLGLAGRSIAHDDRWLGRLLFVTAAGLVFLSADEVAVLHEQVTKSLRHVEALPRFSGDHGIWIPLYAGAGITFAAITWPLWMRLRRLARAATTLFAAGVVTLAAAVVLEVMSYGEAREPANWASYRLLIAAEESLEMLGATLLLVAALQLLAAVSRNPSASGTKRSPARAAGAPRPR